MGKLQIIQSQKEDLGGFFVHRALPGPKMRFVGPFVFFDHMGPMLINKEQAIDVRPHPHIGLATVTYLFEGRCTHRDSLGTVQVIKPGDINWMTAGRGIVHSERTPPEDRNPADRNVAHGIQVWVGLPKKFEECEPSFAHWDKESLPTTNLADGLTAKVMIGRHGPISSPVKTMSPTLFMDFVCTHDTEKSLEFSEKEVGFYLVSGQATVNGEIIRENTLAFLEAPGTVLFKINNNSRIIVVGGEPFPERRFMWWNFVSSSRARIDQASEAWKNQTMGKVPGEKEYAPLPDDPDA